VKYRDVLGSIGVLEAPDKLMPIGQAQESDLPAAPNPAAEGDYVGYMNLRDLLADVGYLNLGDLLADVARQPIPQHPARKTTRCPTRFHRLDLELSRRPLTRTHSLALHDLP
jgi:hypothetical protein